MRVRLPILCTVVVGSTLVIPTHARAQELVETLVPFATFELSRASFASPDAPADLGVAGRKLFRARFGLRATFTLGAESDGIDLGSDEIRLSFGRFSTRLDEGARFFSADGRVLRYKTRILNDLRRVIIKQRRDKFLLRLRATRINIAEPRIFTIQIGDDLGQIDLVSQQQSDTIYAQVQAVLGARYPRTGVAEARVRLLCPHGPCEVVTDTRGSFSSPAEFGDQNITFDGTTSEVGLLPVVSHRVPVRAGLNDLGLRVLPLLEPAALVAVRAGNQGETVTVSYPPGSSDPEVSITIPATAVVEPPDGAQGPVEVALSRLTLDRLPVPLPGGVAAAAIYAVAPFGTRVTPCADLTMRNTLTGLEDGGLVTLYALDAAAGGWRPLANAEVANSGRDLVAPGALCELSVFFVPCTPLLTTIEASTRYRGTKIARVPVYVAGHTRLSSAAEREQPNVRLENVAAGCLDGLEEIRGWAALPLPDGYGYLSGASDPAVAVAGGVTDLNEITLYLCGDGERKGFEDCDGDDLGGLTCQDLGYDGGSLGCTATCLLDTRACRTCGNGVIEPGEECEPDDDALCPGLCRTDCSCPPVCGDGRRNRSEEQCDSADDVLCPGACDASCRCPALPTTTTTLPPAECPVAFELTPRSRAVSRSGATLLEIGVTGLGHDRDVPGGHPIMVSAQCENASFPCGSCTVTGLDRIEGRCSDDPSLPCDTLNAPDEDDCDGARCNVLLFPPLHNLWGGGPGCFVERLESQPSGTIANETGEMSLRLELAADLYFGVNATQPCPICIGDDVPGDGVQRGTCKGGQADGGACDVHGFDPTFGSTSLDCPPDPGMLGAALPLRRRVMFSTDAEVRPFAVACDFPLSALTCPCAVCAGDATVACASDQDCIDTGAAGPCDARGSGILRVPNACQDYECSDTGDGVHGRCTIGPDDRFCDGMLFAHGTPYLPCLSNADCDALSGACRGDCGQCTISQRRSCFLDPIRTATLATPQRSVVSDVLCLAPGVSQGLDQVGGLAGPERLTVELEIRRRFAPP